MRIGITLNEVFRDTLTQFYQTYEKYVGVPKLAYNDIKTDDYRDSFDFSTNENFTKFTYESVAVEIFGFADQMNPDLFENTSEFLYDFIDDNHNITIVSKELNRGVPATFFWLSKINSGFRRVDLVDNYSKVWDDYDIIITATPEILNSKPSNKISIKIDSIYNEGVVADYTFKDTNPLFKDGYLNKIIKEKNKRYV